MLVSFATIAITTLLVATVVLSWVGDLRRAGRATSAREATETLSSHDQRIRQMQARIRAERLRRERVHGPPPPPPGPRPTAAPPPPPDDARHREVLELGAGPVTPDRLRRQYRTLVAAYHPDRVAGLGHKLQVLADEETKAINAAYSYFKRRLRDD